MEGSPMATIMSTFKATSAAHLGRDLANATGWVCPCEACIHVRALVGLDKALRVRPLVRAIGAAERCLDGLPAGPARQAGTARYLRLYDELASVMAE
jgi:hypothetical protein